MKNILTKPIICALLIFGSIGAQTETHAQAPPQSKPQASKTTLRGHILNDQGADVSYATVMLRLESDTTRVFGAASDINGNFRIEAPQGDYRLQVSFVGFDNFEQLVTLSDPIDIGTINLKAANVEIGGVVVKANFITREADRFVVNVGESPLAIGRSATEMLALSPGIFIQEQDGTISINGSKGTQVMINDRLLRERGADLLAYLSNLKAEDIQRIEVIPNSGADQDADMIGGIIKITLKKQRNDGTSGSAGIKYGSAINENVYFVNPSFTINYKHNKFSSYTSLNFSQYKYINRLTEETNFKNSDQTISSATNTNGTSKRGSARIGGIYEINNKQSVGLEGGYFLNNNNDKTLNELSQFALAGRSDVNSLFLSENKSNRISLSGNYINKLDDKGSLFKLLLDYNRNNVDNPQNFQSEFRGVRDFDTTYRSFTNTTNQIYSAAGDFDLVINKTSRFKTGLKYTRNTMDNTILFESWHPDIWSVIPSMTNDNAFTEDIGALYGNYSTRFKNNMSLSLGLRGEYTHSVPWTTSIFITKQQNYFGVFPTVNFSMPLNKKQSQMLTVNYNRKISRPSFWQLNPFRFPLSEFTFGEGNPRLKPAYLTNYSVSYVLAQKYNFTFGHRERKDGFGQVAIIDPENTDVLILRMDNVAKEASTYASVNLPTELTSWWRVNVNLNADHTVLHVLDQVRSQNSFSGNLSNNFTLSKIFTFSVDGFYMSPSIYANMKVLSFYQMNTNLSAKFAKNKINASIFVNDVLNSSFRKFIIDQTDLHKNLHTRWGFRQAGISFRYNFKSGKDFKVKNVESGAEEDKSRLN